MYSIRSKFKLFYSYGIDVKDILYVESYGKKIKYFSGKYFIQRHVNMILKITL